MLFRSSLTETAPQAVAHAFYELDCGLGRALLTRVLAPREQSANERAEYIVQLSRGRKRPYDMTPVGYNREGNTVLLRIPDLVRCKVATTRYFREVKVYARKRVSIRCELEQANDELGRG